MPLEAAIEATGACVESKGHLFEIASVDLEEMTQVGDVEETSHFVVGMISKHPRRDRSSGRARSDSPLHVVTPDDVSVGVEAEREPLHEAS